MHIFYLLSGLFGLLAVIATFIIGKKLGTGFGFAGVVGVVITAGSVYELVQFFLTLGAK